MHVRCMCGGAYAQCTHTVAARHTAQAGAVGLELVQPQHGPCTRAPTARRDGARARPAATLPPPRALCAACASRRGDGRGDRRGDGRGDGLVATGGAPHGLCSALALSRCEPYAPYMHRICTECVHVLCMWHAHAMHAACTRHTRGMHATCTQQHVQAPVPMGGRATAVGPTPSPPIGCGS